MQNLAVKCFCT